MIDYGDKNLAGHDMDCYLFHFRRSSVGTEVVFNQEISNDMYPDVRIRLEPIIYTCCLILRDYKHLFTGDVFLDGSILTDGCLEVMLPKGIGRQIPLEDKEPLLDGATQIGELLIEVMNRRIKEGDY